MTTTTTNLATASGQADAANTEHGHLAQAADNWDRIRPVAVRAIETQCLDIGMPLHDVERAVDLYRAATVNYVRALTVAADAARAVNSSITTAVALMNRHLRAVGTAPVVDIRIPGEG